MQIAETYVNSLILIKEDIVYQDKLSQTSILNFKNKCLKLKNEQCIDCKCNKMKKKAFFLFLGFINE